MARDTEDARAAMLKLHEEGKAPAIDPQAPTKHGLFIGPERDGAVLLSCDYCPVRSQCSLANAGGKCDLERAYTHERRQQLTAALVDSGHDPELHQSLVASAILAEIRLARAMRAVGRYGELIPPSRGSVEIKMQPVAAHIPRLQAAMERALTVLDLTPKAKREVRTTELPVIARLDSIEAEEHAKRAQTVDAEFIDEEADADGDA